MSGLFFRGAVIRCVLCLLVFGAAGVLAQERIISFDSDIAIDADASMVVTETITVNSAGLQIQRGIFRDFPTRYRDRLNNNYNVGFELLEVTRDGQPDQSRVETRANGLRIYIGDANTFLTPGVHRYTLQYRTSRQLGFFDDADELYWNVTGNGWDFSIEQASATIHLPVQVPAGQLELFAYTGGFGSSEQNYEAGVLPDGDTVNTSVALPPRSGLTVVLRFPKGVVTAPTQLARLGFLLLDNIGIFLGLFALAGSLGYLIHAWSRVGRDPRSGIIIPRYKAPQGYSPGACRYIWRMGYDLKTFSCAIVGLAVKGHLSIKKELGCYELRLLRSAAELAAGEQVLLNTLFEKGDMLSLDNTNQAQINRARRLHEKALRTYFREEYFQTNGRFLLPSLLVSLVLFFTMIMTHTTNPVAGGLFGLTLVVHLLFIGWMRAPSRKGRLLLDKLDGLKLFLDVSEKEELELRHPPEKTPELFEALLPFAMALEVEQRWAERFTRVFSQMQDAGQAYHPMWYAGAFHAGQMGAFTKDVSSSFTSSISSAAIPPGSRSAGGIGGGGFSGGGGGGGGGGGW